MTAVKSSQESECLYFPWVALLRRVKPARTIADLAGVEQVQIARVAEAVQYRPRRQA